MKRSLHPTELEALRQLRRLAIEGLGEHSKAHGVTLIVCDSDEVMRKEANGEPVHGEIQKKICDYRHLDVKLGDFKTLQAAAKEDGAVVVDRATRTVIGANFIVTNIGPGRSDGGGARDRAASAIAQQAGGCFVLKASEDACALSATEKPDAELDVFLPGHKESVKVPVQPREQSVQEQARRRRDASLAIARVRAP